MRNFDNDLFFEKPLTIAGSEKQPAEKTDETIADIKFFPEGGSLINAIESRVGLKAVNVNGLGVEVSGIIKDDLGQKIAAFESEHAGMGSFLFKPVAGRTYQAIVHAATGKEQNYSFPVAKASGYILSIDPLSNDENIVVKITGSPELASNKPLKLLAQSNGVIYDTTLVRLNNPVVYINSPKSQFPTGIIQFTLFSNRDLPVAERLVFMNRGDQINFNIDPKNIDTKNSAIDFSVLSAGETLNGNFSVSVTDVTNSDYSEENEITILSNLLLTSDLKGYIEHPNYYFNGDITSRAKHLDDLLLTQGWRRFKWEDLLVGKMPEMAFLPQPGLEIRGRVTSLGNQPLKLAKLSLFSVTDGFSLMLDTISDNNGNFSFDRLNFPDSVKFMIQARNRNGGNEVKVVLDKGPQINPRKWPTYTDATGIILAKGEKINRSVSAQYPQGISIEQVDIKTGKKLVPIVNIPFSKSRNGSADHVITREKLTYQTGDMFQVFYSVPGVRIDGGNRIVRSMTNTSSIGQGNSGKPQPMVVLLDGVETDQEVLKTLPASSIEGVEVLTSNYNTAVYDKGYWGIILITTKMGGSDPFEKLKKTNHIANISGIGFSSVKEYYAPEIIPATGSPAGSSVRHNPPLIYWNPSVDLNSSGKASVKFARLTSQRIYRIIVEGMNNSGHIGRSSYILKNK
ncbi:MAG: hypothetical protein EOP48_05655 [Sphingobacteriales bacterium]|nr:MAG: hypothetical protein EOP48_05655 [Sphingobacteriales bacterium]